MADSAHALAYFRHCSTLRMIHTCNEGEEGSKHKVDEDLQLPVGAAVKEAQHDGLTQATVRLP